MATHRDAAGLWFEMTGHTPKTEDEKWAAWLLASLQDANMFVTWEVSDGPEMSNVQGDVLAPVPEAGSASRVELLGVRPLRGEGVPPCLTGSTCSSPATRDPRHGHG